MNTVETLPIVSSSSSDTLSLGVKLGQNCRGGEVFVLTSDLGGGKTTLTQGIAKGLGIKQPVTSPTFTVSRSYQGRDGIVLNHFDFYRLNDPGVVAFELAEISEDTKNVVVIEWGDIVESVLPDKRILITINPTASHEDARDITIKLPKSLSYLKESL